MTTDTTTTDRDNPNFIENDLDRTPDKAFRDYDLDDRLVDALEAKGITHPFPIQELTLPVALKGQDIIGQARTGTGKTLGFGLPMIQRLTPGADHTQALIVTPTRELCIQVYEELRICEAMGYTSTTVYGGVGYEEQTEALTGGVDIVVGTPGRLLDMLGRNILDLSKVSCVILDEADEMLDMGFLPDVERLLNAANSDGRHTMLFSATMPATVVKLARRYTDNPLFMGADSVEHETAPTVDQHFFQVFRMDKPRVLARILQQPERGNVYVFCRTKAMCDRLVRELEDLGVPAIAIHGDLRQAAREKNLDKFRDGNVGVLVATEVAARGIDVENVTHVVNYDLPDDEKMYLHRIGRTARAGNSGVAVTFAEHNELARLHMIKKAVQQDDETIEVFSTSDVLTELFDLPEETPWGHLAKQRSGGGGRRSNSSSREQRKGSRNRVEHDADLDSDHDRDRKVKVRRDERSAAAPRRSSDDSRSRSRGRDDAKSGDTRSRSRDDAKGSDTRSRSRSSSDEGSSRSRSRSDDGGRSRSGSGESRERSRSRSGVDSGGSSDERRRSRSQSRDRQADGDSGRSDSGRSRSRSGGDEGGSRSSSGGRVRARGGKPVDGRSRSEDQDSGGRSRSSSRSRDGGGNGNGNGGNGSGRSRQSGGRSRSQSSGGSGRSGSRSSDDGSSDRGGSSRGDGNRGGRNRNSGGSNRSGGGSRGKGGNRGSGGGKQRSQNNRSSGNGGSTSGGNAELPRKVRTTRSGPEARGDGQPRLERRVSVEQLP